jgi:hypothetical protein
MLLISSLLAVLSMGTAQLAVPQNARDWYTRGQQAFARHQIDSARTFYAQATLRYPGQRDDTTRALALRKVATLQWRFYRETGYAGEALDSLLSTGLYLTQGHVERARTLRAGGNYTGAFASALLAARHVRTRADQFAAATSLAAVLSDAFLRTAASATPSCEICTRDRAAQALSYLEPLVRAETGQLEPSRQLLRLALMVGDGPLALFAWQSYYLLGTGDTTRGPLASPRRALARLLPSWRPAEETAEQRAALVKALARSGMFPEVLLVSSLPLRSPAPFDAETRADVQYARFLLELEERTDEYYRGVAIGRIEPTGAYDTLYESIARAFWPKLEWPAPPPPFSVDTFNAELARRFGAHMTLGNTAGYSDLHFGHRVVDDERSIVQHGERADFRYISLDGMASNGFQTWAWDGASMHGGWSTGTHLVVQVRPSYAQTPLRMWREASDSAEQLDERRRILIDSAADWERAARNPTAYLPGLALRLHRDGREALLRSLTARGLSGTLLRETFVTTFANALAESAIFAHEGRHAIDARLIPGEDAAEKEFRAKLSEVVFAPVTRLALGAIVSPNSGDATPHGKANARVLTGVLAWMRTHAAEITGLNRTLPLQPQFTLLTDEQIKAAFLSLDPLAVQNQ